MLIELRGSFVILLDSHSLFNITGQIYSANLIRFEWTYEKGMSNISISLNENLKKVAPANQEVCIH